MSGPEEPHCTIQLSLEFCSKCALIRCKSFEDDSHDYTQVGRTTGHLVPGYAVRIPESFWQRGAGVDEFIVEVGANDGAFLDVLAQAGFTNRLGVEPSRACAAICHSKGHSVENVHLDYAEGIRIRERYGLARAVVCRHTLEHAPDPLGLLLAMRALLYDDGILLVEVPDARGITHNLRGHDLWDEHLFSFTPQNLSLLVRQAGFGVDEASVTLYHGAANVLLWCSPRLAGDEHASSFSVFSSDVRLCRRFRVHWTLLCEHILADLQNWPRPIVCIGASHPRSNFLLFTELSRHVTLLVDDDPAKVGHCVPLPQPVPVISTAQFLDSKPPGTVIRGAFGYERWMDQLLAPLVEAGVWMVYPYNSKFISWP